MKNGLLICQGTAKEKNIGDYIQSLASEQFFSKIDVWVEREELKAFQSEKPCKVIMNAWFMKNPSMWPPSSDIIPLLISMHISPKVASQMLTKESIDYLQKNSPIGCRDLNTQCILKEKGISCYFSGCLTLCLGEKYCSSDKTNEIIFVDPYYEVGIRCKKDLFSLKGLKKVAKDFYRLIRFHKQINELMPKFSYEFSSNFYKKISPVLDRRMQVGSFIATYTKAFDLKLLLNSIFLSHKIKQEDYPSTKKMMDLARDLVFRYAKAKMVITSRLHCALPCLGVETPVLFISSDNLESYNNPLRSAGRFDGLIEFVRTLRWTSKGVFATDDEIKKIIDKEKLISLSTTIKNKNSHITLKEKMLDLCYKFAKGL
ncbi:MAG: polysaccharide pyruvyl transferase family protein [Clostridiaceae bacterium]|nr:polysaccharide pyruvyl transferase family protein [Clostridiaceae bacterium]